MAPSSVGLIKLRLSAFGTIALVISASTLFFAIILSFVGIGLIGMIGFVVIFNIIQWLFAPKLINRMYHTREVNRRDDPHLYGMVERLSRKMDLRMPKVMEAKLPMANAFAYGSPLTGNLVAVTTGLRKELNEGEVESVVGHELGHLKNRDVQAMVF
ncbi:MAG: M48 family metalloprotease, partial [Nitrososphaerales archaeon]